MNTSDSNSFEEAIFSVQTFTAVDFLTLLYEEGIATRRIVKQTLNARRAHRSYEIYLYGNPGGIQPYRMNGTTHGMSCSELYLDWRNRVLEALRRPDVPKYLMLKFTTSPEVLIERCFEGMSSELQQKKALTNFDQALDVLLSIIRDIPQPTTQPVAQELTPQLEDMPAYSLSADMEDRRLVIHAGIHTLIAKHRLTYNGNPHRLLKYMLHHKGQELTNEQAGLPPTLKLSDVVQGIGFTGLIHRKLLMSGYHTVTLKDGATLDEHELRELLATCQGRFDVQ